MQTRNPQVSKGSAFLWFATGKDANAAALHFATHPCALNEYGAVIPGSNLPRNRVLVVRRAKARTGTPASMAQVPEMPSMLAASMVSDTVLRCVGVGLEGEEREEMDTPDVVQ